MLSFCLHAYIALLLLSLLNIHLPSRQSTWCTRGSDPVDLGHVEDINRGWYDVTGCGKCKDYCRWVGPWTMVVPFWSSSYNKESYWSCSLAGSGNEYTVPDHFPNWPYTKCSGKDAITPPPFQPCFDASPRLFVSNCEKSIGLLAGSETSIGTIRNIADNIEKYGLPGSCCRTCLDFDLLHFLLIFNMNQAQSHDDLFLLFPSIPDSS